MASIAATDVLFMERALALAAKAADAGEVPVGAVVVHEGEIVGEGYNQPIASHDPTAHAEIQAIRMACATLQNYRIPNTTLYVTLEPCSMCAGAMVHARIARLVFGTHEPKAGAVQSTQRFFDGEQLNHRVEWEPGVLAESASLQMRSFFKQRRAQKKAAKIT